MKTWLKELLQNYKKHQSKKTLSVMCLGIFPQKVKKQSKQRALSNREMNHMVLKEELLPEPEYNPFWTPNNQQACNYELGTYYNRVNYCNHNCWSAVNR